MKLILTGIVEGISTRVDGTLKFTIGTQELDPANGAALLQVRGKFVKVLISDSNITPIEESLVDAEEMQGGRKAKSPSQRLRNVMYRAWEHNGIPGDFDTFYKAEMEKLIEEYKKTMA